MALPEVGTLGFVNHAVTLLKNNRTLKSAGGTTCGQAIFTDPRHRTLAVPSNIQKVLDIWFGIDPERCYFDYRMFLLLQVLHSTEYAGLVLDRWPRTTYDLQDSTLLDAGFGGSSIVPLQPIGADVAQIAVIGEPVPDHQKGRLQAAWVVRIVPADDLWGGAYPGPWGGGRAVTITNLADGVTLPGTVGETSFPLHSTTPTEEVLRIYFATSTGQVPEGVFTITALARPSENLPEIERRIRALGDDVLADLFSSSPEVDLGRKLFEQHFTIAYRLTGVVMALVFKLEELRQQGRFRTERVAVTETLAPEEEPFGFLGGGTLQGQPEAGGFLGGGTNPETEAPGGYLGGGDQTGTP